MTQHLAAGGFRDMTRIAEAEPSMWTSILLTNQEAVLGRIEDFKGRLDQVANWIRSGDEEAVWQFFDQGRQTRKSMEIHKRGGVDSFYDLYVNIPDEEGQILKVMELLRGMSLMNIRINEENREDLYGVLQITFKNQADQHRSKAILEEKTNYQVFMDS